MSRQQTRSSGDGAIDPSLVQKKRARHRLVGAICLCILAAIIVPLVLESEPRPRDQGLPIELAAPARGGAETSPADAVAEAATSAPGTPAATGPLANAGETAGRIGGAVASGQIGNLGGAGKSTGPQADAPKQESRSAVKTVTPGEVAAPPAAAVKSDPPRPGSASQAAREEAARQAAAKQESPKQGSVKQETAKPEAAKPEAAKPEAAKQEAAKQEAAKAAAASKGDAAKSPAAAEKPAGRSEPDVLARLIERADNSTPGGATSGKAVSRKFLVQIGAYSNVQSAKTASDRATQLGLRPFQETVKTAQGDWIRVRIGPFTTRQDAERAQQDLKRAGVTAAIIAL